MLAFVLVSACAGGTDGSPTSTAASLGAGAETSSESTSSMGSDGGSEAGTTTSSTGVPSTTTAGPDPSDSDDVDTGDTGTLLPCDGALETFDVDPAWMMAGLPNAGNDFGWRTSAFAGGNAGEIGGTLQRSALTQYFGDTGISIDAGDCVSASGRLVAPSEAADYDSTISFGHFSTSGSGLKIGFGFSENPDSTLRVLLQAGAVSFEAFTILDIATPRAWSYQYDPVAATMTLTMDGLGTETATVTAQDVAGIEGLDAFGLSKIPHDLPDASPGLLELYLDDVTYTR